MRVNLKQRHFNLAGEWGITPGGVDSEIQVNKIKSL